MTSRQARGGKGTDPPLPTLKTLVKSKEELFYGTDAQRTDTGLPVGDGVRRCTGRSLILPDPEQIKSKYGWIDTFYPPEKGHIFHDGLLAGEYTDDTEQSMALMNAYIRDKKVVPMSVVKEIIAWADRVKDKYASPLGPSTERALKNIAAGGDITVSGKWGNTNGSSMRIAPLGIIHGLRGSTLQELARDVALTDLATHNTRVCNAAATAIAWGVAQAMRGEENLDKIVDATIEAAAEGAKYGFSIPSPDIGMRIALACDIVRKAKDDQQALHDLYAMFGGGDLSADSIPSAIALFLLGKGDVKKTLEYCVNFGGDCDTNGAMAGAMVGAMAGIDAVPQVWRDKISEMNACNFAKDADEILALIPQWHVASESDVADLIKE